MYPVSRASYLISTSVSPLAEWNDNYYDLPREDGTVKCENVCQALYHVQKVSVPGTVESPCECWAFSDRHLCTAQTAEILPLARNLSMRWRAPSWCHARNSKETTAAQDGGAWEEQTAGGQLRLL